MQANHGSRAREHPHLPTHASYPPFLDLPKARAEGDVTGRAGSRVVGSLRTARAWRGVETGMREMEGRRDGESEREALGKTTFPVRGREYCPFWKCRGPQGYSARSSQGFRADGGMVREFLVLLIGRRKGRGSQTGGGRGALWSVFFRVPWVFFLRFPL